jgi:hypothetical protein
MALAIKATATPNQARSFEWFFTSPTYQEPSARARLSPLCSLRRLDWQRIGEEGLHATLAPRLWDSPDRRTTYSHVKPKLQKEASSKFDRQVGHLM